MNLREEKQEQEDSISRTKASITNNEPQNRDYSKGPKFFFRNEEMKSSH